MKRYIVETLHDGRYGVLDTSPSGLEIPLFECGVCGSWHRHDYRCNGEPIDFGNTCRVAAGMTYQAADKWAERLNLRHNWGT